jgi:hypothetical protein
MWKAVTKFEGCGFKAFSQDLCFAQTIYPTGFVKGVSKPVMQLIAVQPEPRVVWAQEGDLEGRFYREFYGEIYGTVDDKNLYKFDKEKGASLFMEGTTYGRFLGRDRFLYCKKDIAEGEDWNQSSVATADTDSKEIVWERSMPAGRFLNYWGIVPIDTELVMLRYDEHDGFDILNGSNGNTLWSANFPPSYTLQGDLIVTPDHVIYMLHRDEGPDIYNAVLDSKIYVHEKLTGKIVRTIDDVPFHYGNKMHYQFSSGLLIGAHDDSLFTIDPVNGSSFFHYKLDLGYRRFCKKIIGEMNNEIVLFMYAEKDRQPSTEVVHFDTKLKEVTYKQSFDYFFDRNRHIGVDKGFLFITDRNDTTHIYQWVPA